MDWTLKKVRQPFQVLMPSLHKLLKKNYGQCYLMTFVWSILRMSKDTN